MYCPRCGQQQVSEEIRFCSRCGLPLDLIAEVLAHGGSLPQLAELYKSKKWLTRKHGVVFSALWTIFFLLILSPLASIADIDALAAIAAVIGIFGGLMWLIVSLVLIKRDSKQIFAPLPTGANINNLNEAQQRNLPPMQSPPAQSYVPPVNSWKAPDTGEFAQPSSVTESTTKLLKNEK